MVVRVFLVDDHEVVRRGIRELLAAEDDLEVVGEAGTFAEAMERVPQTEPDVALLDLRLPDGNGAELCRELRSIMPRLACLMLTSFDEDEALFEAVVAGAAGYLLKQVNAVDIVDAIRRVGSGYSLIDPNLASRVIDRLRSGVAQDARLAGLSGQERHILELLGRGLTNRQMASELFLAEKTVKNYMSSLLSKLGMTHRTEAALYAASHMPALKRSSGSRGTDP